MTLDPKAMDRAYVEFRSHDDVAMCLFDRLSAAILAYEAAKPREAVTEEEVARAAAEAERVATYETVGRPYLEREQIDNWPEIARACLTAARKKD